MDPMAESILGTEPFWKDVKEQFSLEKDKVHLALCMLSSHPLCVRKAIDKHRRNFDKNPALYYRKKDNMVDIVLDSAAKYLKGKSSDIALTESTTMGLSIVYMGMRLKPSEEILTTTHEHYATDQTLHYKAIRCQATLKKISLYEDPREVTTSTLIEKITKNISEKTRIIALTWVHSCSGVKLPIKEISNHIQLINTNRKDHEKIIICVDAAHGLGVEYIENIADFGCDFFVAGCHKWLFGPRGTGIVWGSQLGWSRVDPTIVSFDKEAFLPWRKKEYENTPCPKARLCSPGGFTAYEHRWALTEAFHWHLEIGQERISNRIHELNSLCKKLINKIMYIAVPP